METPSKSRSRRPFFGWWIVAGTIIAHGVQGSTFGFAYGAYLLQLQGQFGWSKFAISSAYSLSQLATGLIGPMQGWLVDRFGPRAVMRAGVVMFGLSFMAFSKVDSLWSLYLAVVCVGLGAHMAGFLTMNAALANWFLRKRARAMGLGSTGLGLAGLLAPIVVWSLATHGWRPTAFASGIAVLVIGLPLTQVFRRRPEDHGLRPDGSVRMAVLDDSLETAREAASVTAAVESVDFTVKEALRDRSFWLVSLGHGTALFVVVGLQVHLVPHLVEGRGWSETAAQATFGLITVTSVLGQVVGGILGDRYSKTRIAAVCMLGHGAAMLMLALGAASGLVFLAAVVHGLAWGVRGPLMMALRADYYGRKNFATIAGYSSMVVMLGPLIGPAFAGAMSDAFNDYRVAFFILGILTGAGSAFFLLARRPPLPSRTADEAREPVATG